jgi:glycosyltransferase involved in cell wall biosynthesis
VLKPVSGSSGSRNTFIVQNADEFRMLGQFILAQEASLLLQEYVGRPDGEYTVGVLHTRAGELVGSIAMNRYIDNGIGNLVRVRNRTGRAELSEALVISSGYSQGVFDDFPEVRSACIRLAEALESKGPINVQCRMVEGKLYPFEINPRLSGTSYMRALAGYNEADLFLRHHLEGERLNSPPAYRHGKVLRGLIERFVPSSDGGVAQFNSAERRAAFRLSVVIPLHNEEENLDELLERLDALASRLAQQGGDTEMIFVDDHSTDGSPARLQEVCALRAGYHFRRLASNCGSHRAILAGMEVATGDCAVFLAGDLQDPPELILEMLEGWKRGYPITWAVRERREAMGWLDRALAGCFWTAIRRMSDIEIPPGGSDFALIDRTVRETLLRTVGANPNVVMELAKLGFSHTQVQYTKEKRRAGRSKFNLQRRLMAFADAFVSVTYTPLRIISYLGIATSALGFLYAGLVILLRLMVSSPIPGWTALMVVMLIFGGAQTIMLGVLGEYLWRTLEQTRSRPLYFVEKDVSCAPLPPGPACEEIKFRAEVMIPKR